LTFDDKIKRHASRMAFYRLYNWFFIMPSFLDYYSSMIEITDIAQKYS